MKKKLIVVVVLAILPIALTFSQTLFAAKDKSWGYVDIRGNWVIAQSFDDAYAFSGGLARVKKKNLWSYVDQRGELITSFRFSDAFDFEGEVARAASKGGDGRKLMGLIDRAGKWVIMPAYPEIRKFSDNGLAMAKNINGDWGFINKKGQWMPTTCEAVKQFSDGLAMARSKGKWGYIDETCKWAIQPVYDHLYPFHEGYAVVEVMGGLTLIDKENRNLWEKPFHIVHRFSDGVAVVRSGKWGALDAEGNWVLPANYEYIDKFVHGTARAREKGNWGLLDKQGNWIIQPLYHNVINYSEGIARVQAMDLKWGYQDSTRKWLVKPQFESAERFINGTAIVKLNGKWGILDSTGKLTAQPKFDKLRSLSDEAEDEDESVVVD
jgi:hypothetical protein